MGEHNSEVVAVCHPKDVAENQRVLLSVFVGLDGEDEFVAAADQYRRVECCSCMLYLLDDLDGADQGQWVGFLEGGLLSEGVGLVREREVQVVLVDQLLNIWFLHWR